MMKKTVSLGLLASAVLLWMATLSYADLTLTLTPFLKIEERYNDNVFLSETDEEDDFITIISPNIELGYHPNRYLDLDLEYGFNFRFYADHSNLNDTNLRETQHANLRAQVRPLNRVFIDVHDFYRRVPVDVRQKVATDNDFENMTDSNEFSISPYVQIPITTTIMSRFGYRFRNMWYEDDIGNNSDSHLGFASLTKQFSTELSMSLGYDYLAHRPEFTNDYDAHHGFISANYQMASNLRFWAGAGRYYIDFDDISNDESDSWDIGTEYRIDEMANTTLVVTYRSSIAEKEYQYSGDSGTQPAGTIQQNLLTERNSITTGATETDRVDLILTTGKYVDIRINPYYSDSKGLETDREDEITGITMNIQKALTTDLKLILDGLWEKQEFSPRDDEVRRYSVSGSFDYILSRSIVANVGYRYNERDSDVSGDDYTNNIVWVQSKMTF